MSGYYEEEIYDFSELTSGNELAGLLDEANNAFNDETFGDSLGDTAPLGTYHLHPLEAGV